MTQNETLETARLTLDRLRAEDAAALAALDTDPEVMRHIGHGPLPPERARAGAAAMVAAGPPAPLGRWAVREAGRPTCLGWLALQPLDGGPEVELAYRLSRDAWGRGIATEAAHRLVTHGFAVLGLPRLAAVTSHANRRSQRVLVKLGFAYRGLRTVYGVEGVWYYDLEARHWSRLEAWRAGNRAEAR